MAELELKTVKVDSKIKFIFDGVMKMTLMDRLGLSDEVVQTKIDDDYDATVDLHYECTKLLQFLMKNGESLAEAKERLKTELDTVRAEFAALVG
jgi:hypothetical protein